jgi:hypothetical protein
MGRSVFPMSPPVHEGPFKTMSWEGVRNTPRRKKPGCNVLRLPDSCAKSPRVLLMPLLSRTPVS